MTRELKLIGFIATLIILMSVIPSFAQSLNTLVKPEGYVAAKALAKMDASAEVLILKDVDAWRFPANEQILNELGIAYSVAGSGEIRQIVPNDYKLIIVASDQPQDFYNEFDANFAKFEDFVTSGGLLQFNAADKGWETGFWSKLPGGVTHKKIYDETNFIINEDHPFVTGVSSPFWGDYASHGHFLNIPGQTTMISRDTEGVQTSVEYRVGSGVVIASTVGLEAAYGWQWDAKQMLVNIITYALDHQGITPNKPPMLRVDPEVLPTVALKRNETDTRILTFYNDGDEDLHFDLEIQDGDAMDAAFVRNDEGVMPVGVQGSENPPEGFQAESVEERFDANAKVLILKDVNPWRETSNERILNDFGVPYSVANSGQLGVVNLKDYELIIVASDQPQRFYDRFDAHLADFEDFVRNGGTLQFNAVDKGWEDGTWVALPGGITHQKLYDRNNDVINPDHPFVQGMPVSFTGNYASHDHFLNVPGKTTMITRDSERLHTTIDYALGDGRVIASGITLEASYAWGWKSGKILVNIIRDALGDIPLPLRWLKADQTSGNVLPGGSKRITLTYDSAGLDTGTYKARIAVTSNDPVNGEVVIPATLDVMGGTCPKADHQSVTACMNVPKAIDLTATDSEGDDLTYAIVTPPQHGILSGTLPNVHYTPGSGYTGEDQFTFKANDGHCDSNSATVDISIQGPTLTVEPGAIHINLNKGDMFDQTLTLTNSGCGTITYKTSLTEVESPGVLHRVGGLSDYPVLQDIPIGADYVPNELIVRLIPDPNPIDVKNLLDDIGAMVTERIPDLNIEVWKYEDYGMNLEELMLDNIRLLSEDPNVLYAEPNYIYRAFSSLNDPMFEELWGLHNEGQANCMWDKSGDGNHGADIAAIGAWERFTTGSSDVVVAVIDSGVDYNHEDLKANIWMNDDETPGNGKDDDGNGFIDDVYGYDFAYNDGDPMDEHYHGTHCAGTIGASGQNDIGVVGVNHKVRIMAVRFLNERGSGKTDDAVRAIKYAIDNGAHILNNSWGGGQRSNALEDAIKYANDRNVLFLAAAGNSPVNTDEHPHYPSCYDVPNVMSVAATDCQDRLASFSSYGPASVDIAAPGVHILSTIIGNGYTMLQGTSMATPHVSGAAALLKAYKPDLSALQIKELLMNSVDSISNLAGKSVTGGRLNVEKALETVGSSGWIRLAGNSEGDIPAGGSVTLTVTLDATGNKVGGEYTANITTVISNDPDRPIQVVVPVKTEIRSEVYTLKINNQGNGKINIDGTLQNLPWEGSFASGKTVSIEAVPELPVWRFKEWVGIEAGQENDNPLTFTMTGNRSITAVFSDAQTVKLTVKGIGWVKVDEAEHQLPWSQEFVKGTTKNIQALPLDDFQEWSGDIQSKENPLTLVLENNTEIRAVFQFKEQWETTILAEGANLDGAGVGFDEYLLRGDDAPMVYKYKVIIGVSSEPEVMPAPPPPPEYTVKMDLLAEGWTSSYYKDIRQASDGNYTWILSVNPHGNIMPPTPRTAGVSWDPETLNPSGIYKIKDATGKIVVADMRTTTRFEVTGEDTPQFFYIEKTEGAFEMALKSGWNMVSLPCTPNNASVDAIFPDAEAVYEFKDQMYELVAEGMIPGKGYWVKVPSDGVYRMECKEAVYNFNIELEPGWHIIGAPYGKARPEPEDHIEVIYCFDDSYYEVRKLERGKGCWIKMGEAATINLTVE